MTYPEPAVRQFIAEEFLPLRLVLNRRADQPHFRNYQIIWTPTIAILDRRGAAHYQSPGFLPPDLFLSMLRVGLARSLCAWGRYDEAAAHLGPFADAADNSFTPEALYWLGVARYLKAHQRAPMMEAWNRLRAEHPESVWAARVPPNQEDFPEK